MNVMEQLISTTPKYVDRGCVRASGNFRKAWLARDQVASGSGRPFSSGRRVAGW